MISNVGDSIMSKLCFATSDYIFTLGLFEVVDFKESPVVATNIMKVCHPISKRSPPCNFGPCVSCSRSGSRWLLFLYCAHTWQFETLSSICAFIHSQVCTVDNLKHFMLEFLRDYDMFTSEQNVDISLRDNTMCVHVCLL